MLSKDSKKEDWRYGVYLCTVNNSFQADILVSKLDSEGIPCEKKYIGASNYLEIVFGQNLTGEIQLYVPKDCLEAAKDIIVPVDLDECLDIGGSN